MKKLLSLAFAAMLVPFAVNAETTSTCDNTSDSSYIQCLITNAEKNNNNTVTIPGGTYTSSPITISTDMEIIGDGIVIITSTDADGGALINITGEVAVSIKNIELVNIADATFDAYAIYASDSTISLTVDGLTTSGFSVGILVKGAEEVSITNSTINVATIEENYPAEGIQLDAVTKAVVKDNKITTTLEVTTGGPTVGIHIQFGTSMTVTGNEIDSTYGIYVYNQTDSETEIVNVETAVADNEFSENCNGEITVFLPTTTDYLYVKNTEASSGDWSYYSYELNGVFYQVTYTDSLIDADSIAFGETATILVIGEGTYEIKSLTITAGQTLVIDKNAEVTVTETIVNDGTIENNGTLKYEILTNTGTYTGSGMLTLESVVEVNTNSAIVTDSETLQSIISDVIASNSALANLVLNAEGDVTLDLTVKDITDSEDTDVKAAMDKITTSTDNKIVSFFDVSLYLTAGTDKEYVSSLTEEITIKVAIPEGLDAVEEGLVREYYILRNHDGEVTEIKGTVSEDGTYVTFTTDEFSPYALSYIDSEVVADDVENPSTGDAIIATAVIGGISLIALAGVSLKLKRN